MLDVTYADNFPSSSHEVPPNQEKVRKNKSSSDGEVLHKKGLGKSAATRDAGTVTRATSTDVKAIQVSLPGNGSIHGLQNKLGRPFSEIAVQHNFQIAQ